MDELAAGHGDALSITPEEDPGLTEGAVVEDPTRHEGRTHVNRVGVPAIHAPVQPCVVGVGARVVTSPVKVAVSWVQSDLPQPIAGFPDLLERAPGVAVRGEGCQRLVLRP